MPMIIAYVHMFAKIPSLPYMNCLVDSSGVFTYIL